MQPHQPYITIGGGNYGIPIIKRDDQNKTITNSIRIKIKKILQKNLSQLEIWQLKKLFGMPATSNIEEIYRRYGKMGLIKVYKKEIKLVLKYVKMLTDSISINWLITADHGERVANFWKDSHSGRRDKEVIEVPWLEIKKRRNLS